MELRDNIKGVQHLGIPVCKMEETKKKFNKRELIIGIIGIVVGIGITCLAGVALDFFAKSTFALYKPVFL